MVCLSGKTFSNKHCTSWMKWVWNRHLIVLVRLIALNLNGLDSVHKARTTKLWLGIVFSGIRSPFPPLVDCIHLIDSFMVVFFVFRQVVILYSLFSLAKLLFKMYVPLYHGVYGKIWTLTTILLGSFNIWLVLHSPYCNW